MNFIWNLNAVLTFLLAKRGAGKTIILRAIDVVFGAKVSKDVLKNAATSALN
jgi:DNA repair ATPase RecN